MCPSVPTRLLVLRVEHGAQLVSVPREKGRLLFAGHGFFETGWNADLFAFYVLVYVCAVVYFCLFCLGTRRFVGGR